MKLQLSQSHVWRSMYRGNITKSDKSTTNNLKLLLVHDIENWLDILHVLKYYVHQLQCCTCSTCTRIIIVCHNFKLNALSMNSTFWTLSMYWKIDHQNASLSTAHPILMNFIHKRRHPNEKTFYCYILEPIACAQVGSKCCEKKGFCHYISILERNKF